MSNREQDYIIQRVLKKCFMHQ